jgi:dihydrofolate reductase
MAKTQYYTATSLDGFIATSDHSLDWLTSRRIDQAGKLGYEPFIAEVGALAMGATTYEWVLDHLYEDRHLVSGKWMYDAPSWVFTHRDLPVPPDATVHFVQGDVVPVHRRMAEAAAGRNLWLVGGGDLVGQFAEAGLLDEVLVAIAPVTLGAGAPLLPRHVELVLEELAQNGEFACVRYSVVRSDG